MAPRAAVALAVAVAILGAVSWLAGRPGGPEVVPDESGRPATTAPDPLGPGPRAPVGSVAPGDPEGRPPVGPSANGLAVPADASAPLAADAPAPGADAPFRGICVDEGGAPVASARVRVVSGLKVRGGGVDPGAFAETVSAPDGTFAVRAGAEVASLRIRVAAEGRCTMRPDEEMARGRVTRLLLLPSCPVRVRVLAREGGAAVPGARVRVYADRLDDADDLEVRVALDEATTDAGGLARLRTPGGAVSVLANPPAHAPALRAGLRVPSAGLDLTLEVGEGGRVEGRVADGEGRPVASARVLGRAALGWRGEATSDEEGRFVLAHLPAAPVTATSLAGGSRAALAFTFGPEAEAVQLAAYAPGSPRALASVPYPSGDGPAVVVLVVRPWERLEGTVVTVEGAPVPSRRVTAGASWSTGGLPWSADGAAPPSALTDASGAFVLDRFAPGDGLTVWGPDGGWPPDWSGVPPREESSGRARIVLAGRPSAPAGPADAKPGAGRATVRVVDAAGRPVAGASLEVGVVRDRLDLLDRRSTDDDGRATVENLPPGRVTVVMHPPVGPSFETLVDGAAAGETVVRLPSGVIGGTVVRPDGSPARVVLRLARVIRSASRVAATLGAAEARTDGKTGAFRFDGVGPGEHVVTADPGIDLEGPRGYVFAGDTDLRYVATTPGETETLFLEADFVDAEDGAAVVGQGARVRLAGAGLSAEDAARSWWAAPVYRTSTCRTTESLPPGEWDVTLSVTGWADVLARGVKVPDGGRPPHLSMRLEPLGRIEGQVVDASGGPPPGSVEVAAAGRATAASSGGRFVLGVPAQGDGTVTLAVSGDLVAPTTAEVRLTAGRAADVRVTVEAAGAVAISLAEGRRPRQAVAVALRPLEGAPAGRDGAARIDTDWLRDHPPTRVVPALVPGRYRLEGTWDGRALAPAEVVVRAGQATAVEVREP